jgi:hypothetical protein
MPNASTTRCVGMRKCTKRALLLLALSLKVMASKLYMWPVPTRCVSSITRTRVTSLVATQGRIKTTSALSWWKAVCLIPATRWLLLLFLRFLSLQQWMEEPSLFSLVLSKSRSSSSHLHSCQHLASMPPWMFLLLLPTQVPRYLLPQDRQVQPIMQQERELFWHSTLLLILQRWGGAAHHCCWI